MLFLFLLGLIPLIAWSVLGPLLEVKRGPARVQVSVISGLILVTLYHQFLRWDIYGLTLRNFLLPVFALIAVLAILKVRKRDAGSDKRWVLTAALVVLASATWSVAQLRYPGLDEGRVDLDWPLAPGHYAVIQGGTPAFNHHAPVTAQLQALDITQTSGWAERRANGILPEEFDAYHIFGTTVVAPCDGTVVHTYEGHSETPIGTGVDDDVAGNMVALQCKDVTVLLAHLQSGLSVETGQSVQSGEPLGRVGSTGNSTEPHLHIHAVLGHHADLKCLLFTCEAVPMYFHGQTFARNDAFEVPDG